MRESEFYSSIRTKLVSHGHVSRIESRTSPGVPDISFAAGGREAWLELKVEKGGKLYFEKTQIVWATHRLKHFPRVWCLFLSEGHDLICLTRMSQVLSARQEYVKDMVVVKTEELLVYEWPRRGARVWQQIVDKIMSAE